MQDHENNLRSGWMVRLPKKKKIIGGGIIFIIILGLLVYGIVKLGIAINSGFLRHEVRAYVLVCAGLDSANPSGLTFEALGADNKCDHLMAMPEMVFRVYKKNNTVFEEDDLDGVQKQSGCTVLDRNDWQCSVDSDTTEGFTNGQFSMSTTAGSSSEDSQIISAMEVVDKDTWSRYPVITNQDENNFQQGQEAPDDSQTIPSSNNFQSQQVKLFSNPVSYHLVGNELVRSCPDSSCKIVQWGTCDGTATIEKEEGNWYFVSTTDQSTTFEGVYCGGMGSAEGWIKESTIPSSVLTQLNEQN